MPTLWVSSGEGQLLPLESSGYDSEKDFQQLLAANPSVLASALDAGEGAGSWLLITRELSIQGGEAGDTVNWSLDHLFVDADGTPILVEVKRSRDPRARREVVGQMLDYAASFGLDWSAERLGSRWEQRIAAEALDRDAEMEAFLESSAFAEESEFWLAVQTKIEAGRLRLLFVADRLSPTLVRIIEYLNVQLRNAEVLGIEVIRHTGGDAGAVVAYQPVVRGRTSEVSATKSAPVRRTIEEFEAALKAHHGDEVLQATSRLVSGVTQRGGFVSVGTSEKNPRLFLNFRNKGSNRAYWPMGINPRAGKVVLFLQYLKRHHPFDDEAVRAQLLGLFDEAAGGGVHGADSLSGAPWFEVHRLTAPGVVENLLQAVDWIVATRGEAQ